MIARCSWPPPRLQRPTVLVLNPSPRDVAIAKLAHQRSSLHPRQVSTPWPLFGLHPGRLAVTAHTTPTSTPSSSPLSDPRHRPRFKLRVIPRTRATDAAKGELASALVAMVGGTWPTVSPTQILQHLVIHFQVSESIVHVCHYRAGILPPILVGEAGS
jgi:hypothetical protein